MTSDDLMWAVLWLLVVSSLCLLMLIKGCVCATTCETMLAECERGLEAIAHQDEDGGCE